MLRTFLGLDISDFQRNAGKADQTLGQFAASAKNHLAGVAGALGLGLSAAGAWQYISGLAEELDAIGKSAARLGVGTEEFQAMSYAAERSGASMDIMEKSLQKVKETVYMAKEGNQQAVETLKALGLSFRDLEGLTPDKMLTRFAEALRNVKDDLTRVNITKRLFGEEGLKLLPMFADLEKLKQELKDTNRIMSDESVKAAEAYQDAMLNLEKSLKSAVANSGIVGWLADVADSMDKTIALTEHLKKAAAQGVFDRKGAIDTAINEASASGKYTPKQVESAKIWAQHYADKKNPDSLAQGGYATIDQMLKDSGFEQFGRTTTATKWHGMHNQFEGSFEIGSRKLTPEQQAEEKAAERRKREQKAKEDAEKQSAAQRAAELAAANAVAEKDQKILQTIEAITKEHIAQATAIQAEIDGKQKSYQLSVMIAKIEEQMGRRLTPKETTRLAEGLDRVDAAKKEAEARDSARKFAESIRTSAKGMGYDLMDRLGFGEQAAQGRAVDDARRAAGGKLTKEQEQEASRLGTLQYKMSRLDQNRPALQDSYITNDLARIGGWSSSVVQADTSDINKSILEQSKQTNALLAEVKETVRRVGEV